MTAGQQKAFRNLAAVLALATPLATPAIAGPVAQPAAVVGDFDTSLLDVMQNARKLGFKGRYEALKPVVQRVFDLPLMTRIAVGTGWSTLTPDQQQQLSNAFGRFIAATYAQRFDGYAGEKFVDTGSRPLGTSELIETKLVKPDGSPVELDYVTRQNTGSWKVVDVFLTGTISELATRRSEFSAVFEQGGFGGLLQTLDRKVAELQNTARVG